MSTLSQAGPACPLFIVPDTPTRILMGVFIGVGVFLLPLTVIGVIECLASNHREKQRIEEERNEVKTDRKFLNITMATVQKTTNERSLSSSGRFEKTDYVIPLNTNTLEVPSVNPSTKSTTSTAITGVTTDVEGMTVIPIPGTVAIDNPEKQSGSSHARPKKVK